MSGVNRYELTVYVYAGASFLRQEKKYQEAYSAADAIAQELLRTDNVKVSGCKPAPLSPPALIDAAARASDAGGHEKRVDPAPLGRVVTHEPPPELGGREPIALHTRHNADDSIIEAKGSDCRIYDTNEHGVPLITLPLADVLAFADAVRAELQVRAERQSRSRS